MENITIDSLNNQVELEEQTIRPPLVGRDHAGRTYQQEESKQQAKPKSTFRARFGSKATYQERSDILDKGIVSQSSPQKSPKKESFETTMKKVSAEVSLKDRDVALAQELNKSVNPGKIPDGHCAKCAFNTHLHFIGRDLQEAEGGATKAFVTFSYWFYINLSPEMVQCVATVKGRSGEDYEQFKQRVREKVQEHTNAGEAILISVGEGAHWYNAYNDGNRIWFVDSQTGKGFNLYGTEPSDFEYDNAWIDIVKVTSDHIDAYDSLWV